MQDYQKRVLTEQKELSDKIINLTVFITDIVETNFLDEEDYVLLRGQLEIMMKYDMILQMRVKSFQGE